jgi:hypothetical protein
MPELPRRKHTPFRTRRKFEIKIGEDAVITDFKSAALSFPWGGGLERILVQYRYYLKPNVWCLARIRTGFFLNAIQRPATNVTNLFFHFRICMPRTSHIKVFFSVYCHAVLDFSWRAALPSVSFCSPTPPSVPTGSFQPSPNEFKRHYIKHGATRPMSIQECRGVGWHHTTGRSAFIPIGVTYQVYCLIAAFFIQQR